MHASTGSKNPWPSRFRAGDRTGSPVQPRSHTTPARRPARIPPVRGPPPHPQPRPGPQQLCLARGPGLSSAPLCWSGTLSWTPRDRRPQGASSGTAPALAGVGLPPGLFAQQGAEGSQEAVEDRDGTCSLRGSATGPWPPWRGPRGEGRMSSPVPFGAGERSTASCCFLPLWASRTQRGAPAPGMVGSGHGGLRNGGLRNGGRALYSASSWGQPEESAWHVRLCIWGCDGVRGCDGVSCTCVNVTGVY